MARKQFVPPTVEEVRAYILAKGLWRVDAAKFVRFYTENEWRDSNEKPIKVWKLKVLYWEDLAEQRGDKPHRCHCGKYAEYIGKDDTGKPYWRCTEHRPRRNPVLPASMTANIGKPVPEGVNVNNERNRQLKALKEKP